MASQGPENSNATVILVLGLLSVVTCPILGPVSWMMGNNYMNQCILEDVEPEGLATAGRILGMIGTGLMALQVVSICGILGLYALIIPASMM